MKELNFIDVMKNIKEGQVWESDRHRIIKGEYGINISHIEENRKTNAVHFYYEDMFKLKSQTQKTA